MDEYYPLTRKGLHRKLKFFWVGVGLRLIIIGVLLLLSTFLFALRLSLDNTPKINYIFITIPLFFTILLLLESTIKFFKYLSFAIGWTSRICLVSLSVFFGFVIKSLQYHKMENYVMYYPLLFFMWFLLNGTSLSFWTLLCIRNKKKVLIQSFFMTTISFVVSPGSVLIGLNYIGVNKNFTSLLNCLISFFVGDGFALLFILYCCLKKFLKTQVLTITQITLIFGDIICSILFKLLLVMVVDHGVKINSFLLFSPVFIGEILIILLGINVKMYIPPTFTNFEKEFENESQFFNFEVFDYNNVYIVESVTNKNVEFLGDRFEEFLPLIINNPNLTNSSENCAGNYLFFKVWRNKVLRDFVFKHLSTFKQHYNVTFNSVSSLCKYSNRTYLSKINLYFNEDIYPGAIPFGVEEVNFGITFNKDLLEHVIPESVKSIEFGDDFNKPILSLSKIKSLTILRFGWSYNQSFKNSPIPKTIKHLSFGYKFDKIIHPGDLPLSVEILNFRNCSSQKFIPNTIPSNVFYLDLSNYNRKIKFGIIPNSVTCLVFDESFKRKIEKDSIPYLKTLVIGQKAYFLSDLCSKYEVTQNGNYKLNKIV